MSQNLIYPSAHVPQGSPSTILPSANYGWDMGKPTYQGPADALDQYAAIVAANPDVDLKGAKNPYTSRNGHMFSFLGPDGTMALRLSPERYDDFLAAYDSGPVESYGAIMRGYVSVPASLLADPAELQPWFDESHTWIGTLKPKPTKKPAKKSAKKAAKKATKKASKKK